VKEGHGGKQTKMTQAEQCYAKLNKWRHPDMNALKFEAIQAAIKGSSSQ
jgi:hypothetical protein